MTISLIIPCYNAQATIKKCLEFAINQTIPFSEIILVDNNSTDESIAAALFFTHVRILKCDKQGASAARNLGWKKAKSEYIAFVDADVLLEKNWNYHMQKLLNDKEVVASQSKIIPFTDLKSPRFLDKYRQERKRKKTNGTWIELDLQRNITTINTAACVYQKKILLQLNGFEETLLRLEDTDLALKARHLGKLAPCSAASAQVYYSGNAIDYLYRSFKDGKSQVVFNSLWNIKDSGCSFEFVTKKYVFFELINLLSFRLGYLSRRSVTTNSLPRSLKMVNLIQKIKKINS